MTAPENPDEPTNIDTLPKAVVDAPAEYPDGSPVLLEYLKIRPRSRRADFKRQYAKLATMQDKISALSAASKVDPGATLTAEQQAERMELWADADDMYQQMDDLMRLAAVDDDSYTAWSDAVDDEGLVKVFQVFMSRSQPGEASGSAT